jgi:hypothetical protein
LTPRRNFRVGPQPREVGLAAVELRQGLGVVAARHDLQPQPQFDALEQASQLGGKAGLVAVGAPTAKVNVSESLSRMRPPQTVATVTITVKRVYNMTWRRLVLTTCERGRGGSMTGVGNSALMAFTGDRGNLPPDAASGCPAKS